MCVNKNKNANKFWSINYDQIDKSCDQPKHEFKAVFHKYQKQGPISIWILTLAKTKTQISQLLHYLP